MAVPQTETHGQPERWQLIANLLREDSDSAGFHRTYPAVASKNDGRSECSLLDALNVQELAATEEHHEKGKVLHDSISSLINQLSVFESISRSPILAIAGLLNAGKSSLLASYLSPQNRSRVLTGLSNQAGTHRFVLWLPKVWWDDAELLSTLISYVSSVFGHPPEHLSDDPDIAALQYNGQIQEQSLMLRDSGEQSEASKSIARPSAIDVPLIAYDAHLNELKLALIDCPDIQTGFIAYSNTQSQGAELAESRRSLLGKVGRLCSAFIVVSKMNSLHDAGLHQILTTLRDAMPGVPKILGVNKVKARYSPQVVYEQARGLLDRFNIRSVYAAYDFRSTLAASRIPAQPAGMLPSVSNEPQPIFFESATLDPPVTAGKGRSNSDKDVAAKPENAKYLFHLGEELDVGALTRESSRSLKLQLKTKCAEALEWYRQNDALSRCRQRDAWQATADACYEFMAERDGVGNTTGLRLQASPAIVAQMADSLQRTAPPWMRFSLKIDKTARQFQQAVANSASRFKILQSAGESVAKFTRRFRRGEGAQVVTPERLAKALRSYDIHDAFYRSTTEQLRAGCELAIQRFADEDKTQLDQQELDEWSRQVWASMSIKEKLWKSAQPLAVMMGPLLAAVLVPFDGGGSAVLVFASTKELIAAAGIAAVLTPVGTGGEALRIVHRETPWRQLSDLFAILCDSIGLPRPEGDSFPLSNCDGTKRPLLPSGSEVKSAASRSVLHIWESNETVLKEFQVAFQSLET